MKTEMKVLLYLKRNGQNEQGMCPLMGRISIKGKCNSTAQFSCKATPIVALCKHLPVLLAKVVFPV
jgi:hypothetical protein